MARKLDQLRKKKKSESLFVNDNSDDSEIETESNEDHDVADEGNANANERSEAEGGAEQPVVEEPLSEPSNPKKKIAIKPTMNAEQTQEHAANLLKIREMLAKKNFFKPTPALPENEADAADAETEPLESQDENAMDTDISDDEEKTASPKKRSRPSPKKPAKTSAKTKANKAKKTSSKPTVKAKTKDQTKKSARPAINARSLLHSDLLSNAARAEEAPDLPTFQSGTRRNEVLKGLMASLPESTRKSKESKADLKWINNACKVFGHQQVKPSEGGLWKVAGMKTALKPHQILGTAFMLGREAGREEPRGGILADEMGLGKTIMTLALIVSGRPLSRAEVSPCASSSYLSGHLTSCRKVVRHSLLSRRAY